MDSIEIQLNKIRNMVAYKKNSLINPISSALRDAIDIVNGRRISKSKPLSEPSYSAALAIEFPNLMNNRKKKLPNLTFGGCFIHQSPKVSFTIPSKNGKNNTVSCELGDVLFILRKRTMDDTRYNAALLQLKKTDKPSISITGKAKRQLHLYENWPKFTLSSNGNDYDVYPKAVTQGALYGIILEWNPPQLFAAEPISKMGISIDMTLGRFMRDAINWQTGRSISSMNDIKNTDNTNNANNADSAGNTSNSNSEDSVNKNNIDEWSRLIWDLLEFSAKKPQGFNVSETKYNQRNCFSGNYVDFINDELGIDFGTPSDDGLNNMDVKAKEGFGILFIDIDERG